MTAYLADTWPLWGALGLVGLITYGALRATISADKKRRREQETHDD